MDKETFSRLKEIFLSSMDQQFDEDIVSKISSLTIGNVDHLAMDLLLSSEVVGSDEDIASRQDFERVFVVIVECFEFIENRRRSILLDKNKLNEEFIYRSAHLAISNYLRNIFREVINLSTSFDGECLRRDYDFVFNNKPFLEKLKSRGGIAAEESAKIMVITGITIILYPKKDKAYKDLLSRISNHLLAISTW